VAEIRFATALSTLARDSWRAFPRVSLSRSRTRSDAGAFGKSATRPSRVDSANDVLLLNAMSQVRTSLGTVGVFLGDQDVDVLALCVVVEAVVSKKVGPLQRRANADAGFIEEKATEEQRLSYLSAGCEA